MYDIDHDDVPEAVLRAREILERTAPSEADIEEQEQRRRQNRLARIMAPPPPPPTVRKVKEDTLVQKPPPPAPRKRPVDESKLARKAEIEAKSSRGERLTRDERAEWWAIHCTEVQAEVREYVRARRFTRAIDVVLTELALVSMTQTGNRLKLEDRVTALEAAIKPRIRVKAPSERST